MWGLDQHQAGTDPSPHPHQPFAGVIVPAVPPGGLQPHCHQELCPHWRKEMLLDQARRAFKGSRGLTALATETLSLGSPSTTQAPATAPGFSSASAAPGVGRSPWELSCPRLLSLVQAEGRWGSPSGGRGAAGEAGLEQSSGCARASSLGKSSSVSWHDEGLLCIRAGTLRH